MGPQYSGLSKRCRRSRPLLPYRIMRRLGEPEKPLRLAVWGHRRFYLLCLGLLALASAGFGQLNHMEIAANLLNKGQMGQAEAEARKALGNPTTRALAFAMLGTIRLQEGRYKESTSFLTQALALNPHLVGARTSLGNACLLQGKTELARKSFQEAVRLDPGNFNARFELAKVEASLHNYRRSLDAAGPIVAQLSGSDDGILLLATDYGSLGRQEELEALARNWEQLSAPSDESSLEFGNVLAMFGMTLEAKQIFEAEEAKIAAHPSSTLAVKLGKSYLSLGILDRAEQNRSEERRVGKGWISESEMVYTRKK